MEKWKNIDDLNFNFLEISDSGRLRNSNTGHVYKLRVQKQTGLSFCDVGFVDDLGEQHRKTIYIAYEVCNAFVKKPEDFHRKKYKSAHKKGVSKLNNLAKNLCWKTQSEFSKENMIKYPQNRNKLANHQKKKFAKLRKLKQKQITMDIGLFSEIYALLGVAKYGEETLIDKAKTARQKLVQLKETQITQCHS